MGVIQGACAHFLGFCIGPQWSPVVPSGPRWSPVVLGVYIEFYRWKPILRIGDGPKIVFWGHMGRIQAHMGFIQRTCAHFLGLCSGPQWSPVVSSGPQWSPVVPGGPCDLLVILSGSTSYSRGPKYCFGAIWGLSRPIWGSYRVPVHISWVPVVVPSGPQWSPVVLGVYIEFYG